MVTRCGSGIEIPFYSKESGHRRFLFIDFSFLENHAEKLYFTHTTLSSDEPFNTLTLPVVNIPLRPSPQYGNCTGH